MTDQVGKEADDLSGRLLAGRYKVVRRLSRGGLASVYLAEDQRSSRPVVVKVPHASVLSGEGSKEQVLTRLLRLKEVQHAHLLPILDVGESEGVFFEVIPHLEGETLQTRLAGGKAQKPADVLGWLGGIAEALDLLHQRGLLHRAVQPANVLLGPKGKAVLAELGLGGALGDGAAEGGDEGAGAASYVAPEVSRQEALGPAFDQYALGVVAFEALGGKPPWRGRSLVEGLPDKLEGALPPLPPAVPAAVGAAVLKALDPDPKRRHASCKAFAEAFRRGLGGQGLDETAGFEPGAPGAGKGPPPGGESETRAFRPMKPDAPVPLAPPGAGPTAALPKREASSTRRFEVTARAKKGPNKLLLSLVLLMLGTLAVVVVLKMRGKAEGPATTPTPTISLQSPGRDKPTNDPLVRVSGTVNDVVKSVVVRVLRDEDNVVVIEGQDAPLGELSTFQTVVELPEDGVYRLEVIGRSAAGREALQDTRVPLDRIAPAFEVLEPSGGGPVWVREGNIRIAVKVDDPFARVWFGAERQSPQTDSRDTYTVEHTLMREGEQVFTWRAEDLAGNTGSLEIRYTLDRTPPALALTSPKAGARVRTPAGRVEVSGTVDDPAAIVTVLGERATVEKDGSFQVRVPVAPEIVDGGEFEIAAQAVDRAGNASQRSLKVLRGDSLIVDQPQDGIVTAAGEVVVQGIVADVSVPVQVGDEFVQPAEDGTFEASFTLSEERGYDVVVQTTDSRGRTLRRVFKVYRDRTPPVLRVERPAGWYDPRYQGVVTSDGSTTFFTGTVEDTSPTRVYVNDEFTNVEDGKWTLPYQAVHGTSEVRVFARDAAGNESQIEIRPMKVWPPRFPGLKPPESDATGLLEYALEKDESVVLVLVPAQSFHLGAVEGDKWATEVERPRREVHLPRFLIAKSELTWRQFLKFQEATSYPLPEERRPAETDLDHPAKGLTWMDVQAWCTWAGLRLPTEAEWECAARGGVDGKIFPWGGEWSVGTATVKGSVAEGTTAVGTAGPRNGYGLVDVIGNVAEWCSDEYDPAALTRDPNEKPKPPVRPPGTLITRSVRGGSWLDGPAKARLSARWGIDPTDVAAAKDIGLRPALSGERAP